MATPPGGGGRSSVLVFGLDENNEPRALYVNSSGILQTSAGGGGGGGDGAILDGASALIKATVFDGTGANPNPLAVALYDNAGVPVGVGGGTQYDEDTASAAAEKLTMAGVVRKDAAASLVGTDGDRTELQVDASGWLRTSASFGGQVPAVVGGWLYAHSRGLTAHDDVYPVGSADSNPVLVGGYASSSAPAAVSADGDVVRAWFSRNGALVTEVANTVTADVTPASPVANDYLPVRLTDGSAFYTAGGAGGGAGIEYTEGDVDATITGRAILWEDTGDTLRAVSAAKPLPMTGNVTANSNNATGAGSIAAVNDAVQMSPVGRPGIGILLTGSWVGTIEFEGSADGGVTWVVLTVIRADNGAFHNSTPSNGTYWTSGGGLTHVRVRASAWTSGTANVNWVATPGNHVVEVTRMPVVNVADGGNTLSVDDAGGSLTVDGTVTVQDGGAAISVDDNGGSLTVDGTVGVSGSVDTELPAAAALADNVANPTVPGVGAFAMIWDGANWDRSAQPLTDTQLRASALPVSGPLTDAQLRAAAVRVGGGAAIDAAVADSPVIAGGRASDAVPTAVSADGDAQALWLSRRGALIVSNAPHVALDGAPFSLLSKTVQQTTAQTGTDILTVNAGKKLVVTSIQIQIGGTTAATVQVWFGLTADTAYTRGTDKAIFDGEFAPSATLKPGWSAQGTWIGAVDEELHLTTSAGITITITVWYYEI